MDRRSVFTGMAGVALAVSAPSLAFAQRGASRVDSAKLPALMGGDFATATSQVALRRSRSKLVTTFAELEIEEQAAVARAYGARPGQAGLRRDQAAMLVQLEALRGPQFDGTYIQGQIKGHRELLRIHQRYSRNGDDPEAVGASLVAVTSIKTHLVVLNTIQNGAA